MVNVLVVDDDADLLTLVGLMLDRPSMRAICISSGNGVLTTLSTTDIDVILMDIFLGEFDGRELCQQLKDNDQFAKIPVLLYSAGQIPVDSLVACKADDFLSKPFDMNLLIDKITLLAKRA